MGLGVQGLGKDLNQKTRTVVGRVVSAAQLLFCLKFLKIHFADPFFLVSRLGSLFSST